MLTHFCAWDSLHLLNQERDLAVCGEAENAELALEAVAACRPDLIIRSNQIDETKNTFWELPNKTSIS